MSPLPPPRGSGPRHRAAPSQGPLPPSHEELLPGPAVDRRRPACPQLSRGPAAARGPQPARGKGHLGVLDSTWPAAALPQPRRGRCASPVRSFGRWHREAAGEAGCEPQSVRLAPKPRPQGAQPRAGPLPTPLATATPGESPPIGTSHLLCAAGAAGAGRPSRPLAALSFWNIPLLGEHAGAAPGRLPGSRTADLTVPGSAEGVATGASLCPSVCPCGGQTSPSGGVMSSSGQEGVSLAGDRGTLSWTRPPPNLQPQLGSPSREGRTPTGAPPSHCLRSATWGRAPGPLPPALRTCLGCTAGPGLTGREQRGRRTPRGPNTSTPRLGSADSPSVCRPAAEGATCTCAPGGRCPTPMWHIPVTLALSGAAAAHTLITGPSSQLGPAAQASAAPSAGREDPVPPPTGAVGQSGGT